ncbi:double-strand break repair protein AddB, partial [Rhodobacterales bacterium HKCCE2091]|nr:double-strand break repair protein AddB [Rhodobacterales bacterium HKCCE2091]
MFDPQDTPRVFATPLGTDFTAALIAGLEARLAGAPPEALARVEVIVATDRMRRRLLSLLAERRASFLPRITPVARLGHRPELHALPPAMSALRLRLTLARLVGALLDREPDLAPRSAIYALADSLAELMGEMQEEGVAPNDINALETTAHAAHWQRNKRFLEIVARVFEPDPGGAVTPEARAVLAIDGLAAHWRKHPPAHPVIVAGSTGSRGATARLMAAVAGLPQGAVILPGLDRDMPAAVWHDLLEGRNRDGLAGEDHPQFRLGRFAERMGLRPSEVPDWTDAAPASPARNDWMSLALRPAPMTDAWRREAPDLVRHADPADAFAGVTLIEAPSPRAEAAAIALRLRAAAGEG